MPRLISTAALLTLLLPPSGLGAQAVTLDLRGAFAMPTSDLDNAKLDPGPGFGATLAVAVMPHLHVYGGWDWVHFASKGPSFAGSELDIEETGYTIGLRMEHPLGQGRLRYRLEAGGTYKHIEVEDDAGEIVVDSKHGLGYEFGAGMLAPLGSGNWRLAATLRYRSLTREFEVGSVNTEAALRYAAIELGVSKRF